MSHRRREGGGGVVDGDPVAWILLLYMFFVLMFWFQSNTSINPIAGNTTIVAAYASGFTGIRWFALLMAPFAIILLVKGFTGEGDVESDEGEE